MMSDQLAQKELYVPESKLGTRPPGPEDSPAGAARSAILPHGPPCDTAPAQGSYAGCSSLSPCNLASSEQATCALSHGDVGSGSVGRPRASAAGVTEATGPCDTDSCHVEGGELDTCPLASCNMGTCAIATCGPAQGRKKAFLPAAVTPVPNVEARAGSSSAGGSSREEAELMEARVLEPGQMQGTVLEPGQMQGTVLEPGQMQGTVLEPCQMQWTVLEPGQIQWTVIEPGQMQGTVLDPGQMQGPALEPGQMQWTVLEPGHMQGTVLDPGQMQGPALEPEQLVLEQGHLEGFVLQPGQLEELMLQPGQIECTVLEPWQIEVPVLEPEQLEGLVLEPGYVEGFVMQPGQLEGLIQPGHMEGMCFLLPKQQEGLLLQPEQMEGLFLLPSQQEGILPRPGQMEGLLLQPGQQEGLMPQPRQQEVRMLQPAQMGVPVPQQQGARKNILFGGEENRSLVCLTQRFLELLKSAPQGLLDLNDVAARLNAHKRRLYDITNVLDGIGLLTRRAKNIVQWIGPDPKSLGRPTLISQLSELETSERCLDELISYTTENLASLINSPENRQLAYVNFHDIHAVQPFDEQVVIVIKVPEETQVHVPAPTATSGSIYLRSGKGPIEAYYCEVQK